MVYRLDTPGVENQAITNAKIDTGAVSTQKVDASINNALVPINGIIMYSGTQASIPANWAICDGNNGTPNLVNKFVIAAATYDNTVTPPTDGSDSGWRTAVEGTNEASGGEATKLLGTANLPSHTHTDGTLTASNRSLTGQIRGISESFSGFGGSASGVFSKFSGVSLGGTPGSPDSNDCGGVNFNASHTHDVTGNTGDQGGAMNTAFNILPPYYALCYIMKT